MGSYFTKLFLIISLEGCILKVKFKTNAYLWSLLCKHFLQKQFRDLSVEVDAR